MKLVNNDELVGRLTLNECSLVSSNNNGMSALASNAVHRVRKLTQIATIKHFLDVYLFLIVLLLRLDEPLQAVLNAHYVVNAHWREAVRTRYPANRARLVSRYILTDLQLRRRPHAFALVNHL